MSNIAVGLPAKVRRTAADFGMHADCMACETENICKACDEVLYDAMEYHYGGHADPHEAMMAMLEDVLAEMQGQL